MRVRLWVIGWAVLALLLVLVLLAWHADAPAAFDGVRPAVLLAVLGVVAGVVRVELPTHGTAESTNLNELAYVPAVLLLPPGAALAVVAVAALVSETVITRAHALKAAFNVAWTLTAVAAAVLVWRGLHPGPFVAAGAGVAAGTVVAVVVVLVNLVAFGGLVALRAGEPFGAVLREHATSAPMGVTTGVLGVVVAVLAVEAPAGLWLLPAPLLVHLGRLRSRAEGWRELETERARLRQTVAGVWDAVALLDPGGRVLVHNDRMAELVPGVRTGARVPWEPDGPGGRIDGARRMRLADRVVEVRERAVQLVRAGDAATDAGSVVSLRDVTREEELIRLREDLVSLVSHELRTPVTTLTGFLVTLDQHWDGLPEPRRRELLAAACRGGHRLGSLVANVAAWARVEQRVFGADTSDRCEVGVVLSDVTSQLGVAVMRCGDLGASVAIAADGLVTILRNLLDNAVTYGAPPFRVEVEQDVADGLVHLHVVDHGPGLPSAFRPALFEPWSQATTGLRRTARGLGMGLAVTRAVVEVAGGTVCHADVPGGGSRFSVALPSAASASGGDPATETGLE